MKRMAMILALLAIGFFPLAASMSHAADSGNRFCMPGSAMREGGMMTGMMMRGMGHAENRKDAPACGMSESTCTANHSSSCRHDMAGERRAIECGA